MSMKFEWDEAKRISNKRKHELDFADADLLFDNTYVERSARSIGGEQRWMAIGRLSDQIITAIYTRRGDVIRLISWRRAREDERAEYRSLYER